MEGLTMTAHRVNYHYAIGTYRISEYDTQERLMLYRFRGKKDRAAWIISSPRNRLAVTRDIARLVFAPHFRAFGYSRQHWTPIEMWADEMTAHGARKIRIKAAYFIDLSGAPISSNYQMCEVRQKAE